MMRERAGGMEVEVREDFRTLLRRYREAARRSRNDVAHEAGVDPSYLTRLEHGDREPPRQRVVEALAQALRLSLMDRNRLLVAAGYAPISVEQLGTWDPALQSVADVLNDQRLSPEEREQFRLVVELIASRWQRTPEPRADAEPPVGSTHSRANGDAP